MILEMLLLDFSQCCASGGYNTAIGFKSMKGTDDNNITGDFNTAFGSGTLELIISGQKNTAIGSNAMKNVGGSQNVSNSYNSGNNISTEEIIILRLVQVVYIIILLEMKMLR